MAIIKSDEATKATITLFTLLFAAFFIPLPRINTVKNGTFNTRLKYRPLAKLFIIKDCEKCDIT